MIDEGEDPIQYHCLFHNFRSHSFALMERTDIFLMLWRAFSDTAAPSVNHVKLLSAAANQLLRFSFSSSKQLTPDMPLAGSLLSRKKEKKNPRETTYLFLGSQTEIFGGKVWFSGWDSWFSSSCFGNTLMSFSHHLCTFIAGIKLNSNPVYKIQSTDLTTI